MTLICFIKNQGQTGKPRKSIQPVNTISSRVLQFILEKKLQLANGYDINKITSFSFLIKVKEKKNQRMHCIPVDCWLITEANERKYVLIYRSLELREFEDSPMLSKQPFLLLTL